jgi:hypothetical protein
MTVNKAVKDMAEMLEEMKPVRYLLRAGCALANGLRVSLSTVAAHYAHLRMCPQPRRHRLCFPIGEEVNHLMPDLIDDDGAVGWPPSEGKIVNPHHLRHGMSGRRNLSDVAQDGIGAAAESQHMEEACSGFPHPRPSQYWSATRPHAVCVGRTGQPHVAGAP